MGIRFNKKVLLRFVSLGVVALFIVNAGLLTGCTVKDPSVDGNEIVENNDPVVQDDGQEKIMTDFEELLGSYIDINEVISYIDQNISTMSKENASTMVVELEKIQKEYLSKLEEKYYSETIQGKINEIYQRDRALDNLDDIQDKDLKAFLLETRDNGYKVETAEGMYFPIINYDFHVKYQSYLLEDIIDYINIMAVESKNVPAKDAALIIEWDEILNRALNQEQFMTDHGNSVKINDVKELHKKYITFIFYGLNNTPLFNYETETMDGEAKTMYLDALESNTDSELIQMLGEYMELLDKGNYKLTEEADQFRKDVLQNP